VTPDPRYLYQSKTHAEARSSLIIGIECGIGFQALIAPPGMGKTTILLRVQELFKDVARTAFLFQIQADNRPHAAHAMSRRAISQRQKGLLLGDPEGEHR
jgi:hypothetical protein